MEQLQELMTYSKYYLEIKVPITILFNKVDLFYQYLEKIPLAVAFPDYKGV